MVAAKVLHLQKSRKSLLQLFKLFNDIKYSWTISLETITHTSTKNKNGDPKAMLACTIQEQWHHQGAQTVLTTSRKSNHSKHPILNSSRYYSTQSSRTLNAQSANSTSRIGLQKVLAKSSLQIIATAGILTLSTSPTLNLYARTTKLQLSLIEALKQLNISTLSPFNLTSKKFAKKVFKCSLTL